MTTPRLVPLFASLLLALLLAATPSATAQKRPFTPADIHRLVDVSDAQISPEGDWVAYVVETTDIEEDRSSSDLFMVRWDGSRRIQLTHTQKSSESQPRFSPDGRYLAFLAARDEGADDSEDATKGPESKTQVWLLDRAGGEARRVTKMAGGVSDFTWSPDSSRLALIADDPDPDDAIEEELDGDSDDDSDEEPGQDDSASDTDADSDSTGRKPKKSKTPKPIVIDRYRFKQDRVGYLGEQRSRLYLFDLSTEKSTLLTPGPFDNESPTWSPDGAKIAFSSKRQGDPDRHDNSDLYAIEAREGAEPIQLTTWEGADSDPVWSPDGQSIAYLQGGAPKYADYDHHQIAVIPASGGEPRRVNPDLDRYVSQPRWSADSKSLYFLLEDDRIETVARVAASGGAGRKADIERFETHQANPPGVVRSFSLGPKGEVAAVITRPHQPKEVFAREGSGWRTLSDHNRALVDEIAWGNVRGIEFASEDGTEIHGMLVEPPGYQPGKRYPTIAYIHGGPMSQDGFELDTMSQTLAAAGYVVVNPNYRGSSGRGDQFLRAIYADWGNLEVQDIHAAVDYLVKEGISDPERLGIGGWSYGGMSTNYAIATDTRFKAAVSGAGIANMIAGYGTDQYTVQYENEVGLPWQELDVYFKISFPFFHADRIQTPTLFLCGEKDFNVPLINSEQMYQALRSLGVPTRLVIYPDQYHGLSKPSYQQDRLERMLDWYGKYLMPQGAKSATAGG